MPDPLPSDVVDRLKSDPTAALAAALIVAQAFPSLAAWATRSFGARVGSTRGEAPKPAPKPSAKGNGAGHAPRPKGANGRKDPRGTAAKHDEALLALMRANPGASTTELIKLNRRPCNSTAVSLDRLEKAGLVEHAGRGKWIPVEPSLLEEPAPKPASWIAPLSGKRVARHAADGRVRDEMTL